MNDEIITFSMVQYSSIKGDVQKNLQNHIRHIKLSAESGAHIVVFPELSLTGYELELSSASAIDRTSSIISELSNAAIENNVVVISGIPLKSDTDKPYIGALISFPSGKTDFYRKQYLHPGEDIFMTAGSDSYSFKCKNSNIFLGICADFTNEQHWIDANANQADIYIASVLISKNGFAHDAEILKHKAMKHQLNVVMANYIGETGGWISHGNSRAWNTEGNVCISANDIDQCLVLCSISAKEISGKVINTTN